MNKWNLIMWPWLTHNNLRSCRLPFWFFTMDLMIVLTYEIDTEITRVVTKLQHISVDSVFLSVTSKLLYNKAILLILHSKKVTSLRKKAKATSRKASLWGNNNLPSKPDEKGAWFLYRDNGIGYEKNFSSEDEYPTL